MHRHDFVAFHALAAVVLNALSEHSCLGRCEVDFT